MPFSAARLGSTTDRAPEVEAETCVSSVASATLALRPTASSPSTPARSARLAVGETARRLADDVGT